MRTKPLYGLVSIAVVLSGCYSLTGQIAEQTTPGATQLSEKQVRRDLPETKRIELVGSVINGRVLLRAEVVQDCRTDLVRRFGNVERVERELPGHYWIVAGTGVAATLGGAGLWAHGSSQVSDGQAEPLGGPELEQQLDDGLLEERTGQVALGVGLVLLASAAWDLVAARDGVRPLEDTTETAEGEPYECERSAARQQTLVLQVGGSPVLELATSDAGEAAVSLDDPRLGDVPIQSPFIVASCALCRATEIDLPPEESARLVLKRDRKPDMVAWLEMHENSDRAVEVRAALAALNASEASDAHSAAVAHLAGRQFAKAKEAATKCLELIPGHAKCAPLLKEITDAEAKDYADGAREFLRKRDLLAAAAMIQACVQAVGEHPRCVAAGKVVAKRLDKETRRQERWGRAHVWRARDTAQDAVAKRLKAPSTARWEGTRILGNTRNNYVVRVVVTAQNAFGVPIRSAYCVTLQLDMKSPTKYYLHPKVGVVECADVPSDDLVDTALQSMGAL